jgi:NAD(P)-dependent dehydrogenase (short-subunit alcohol dehydrogenase family)
MNTLWSMFDLAGKAAIVTGASHGLGVTFAEALSKAGAQVVVAARNAKQLEMVAGRIRHEGGEAVAIPCDVTDPGQVQNLAEAGWRQFGRIDILVNNAGIVAERGIVPEKIPLELFEQTLRVNLVGLWHGCREIGARMLEDGKGGSIINVASVSGLGGASNFPSAYQASKAAVINLTRNLACSWADRGVRVNALAPGWFPSEMSQEVLSHPSFLKSMQAITPMKRIGNPQELIGPLLLLASGASSFMTGHTLVVDGGISSGLGVPQLPEDFLKLLEERVPGNQGRRIRRE